jgi:CheY-like chemotaxis protein
MAKILLIDDELDIRGSVAKVLGRAGHEVVTAENANVGLALLESQHFDILITDIIMPGKDGVQAIRDVRANNPDIAVLAVSGGGNIGKRFYEPDAITTSAYLQAAINAGANGVLTKPFQRQDLIEAVDALAKQGANLQ